MPTILYKGQRYPFKRPPAQSQRAARQAYLATRRGARPGTVTVPRTRGAVAMTERKYFDSFLSASAITASTDWTGTEHDPAGNCLFYPVEGSDINERIGRKVTLVKLTIRGVIRAPAQVNQTAGDAASVVRLILVQDEQTNAAQMQGEQLMSAPGAANALLCNQTFQSTANFGRFRVLKDKTFTLSNPNMAWDGTNIETNGLNRAFKFSIVFKNPIRVRFNSTNGGSVADIVDNSFHLLAQATNVADLAPLLYYQCRCVYMDA